MKDILSTSVSRRGVLAGSAAAAGALAMPSILRAQDKSIKIGVYGGYFKKSFDENGISIPFPQVTYHGTPQMVALPERFVDARSKEA